MLRFNAIVLAGCATIQAVAAAVTRISAAFSVLAQRVVHALKVGFQSIGVKDVQFHSFTS